MNAPHIQLFILGHASLAVDGVPVKTARSKTLLLLALLALYPKGHTRDNLAALLWGRATRDTALLSLRVVLAELRKLLGDGALVQTRHHVQLAQPTKLWVDALVFQTRATAPDGVPPHQWQTAIALYRGDVLPDVDDDWVLPQRTGLAALHVQTLLRLAEHQFAAAAYVSAAALALRTLLHDACEEKAHRLIMRCHEALGDRAAAMAQFEACAYALRMQFGVEPSAETRAVRTRLQAASARADSLLAYPTNLPTQSADFFDRAQVQQDLENALEPLDVATPPVRLLTVTGICGSGKSRMAHHTATELVGSYPGGIWWLDVATLTEAEQLSHGFLQVCGLAHGEPDEPASAHACLINGLRDRPKCPLLLDNCDALVVACNALARQLLAACPNVQVLATSCEALGVPSELLYRVPLLRIATGEAANFFAHCARQYRPGFVLDASTHAPVLAICQLLDGLPLALQLTAGRLQALGLEQLAAKLAEDWTVLSTNDPTCPPRHSSLWARLQASHRVLGSDEQALLKGLARQTQACTLEQAQALGAQPSTNLGRSVLVVLAQLVDKSLLVTSETSAGVSYRLPSALRRFVLQAMGGSGIAGPPTVQPRSTSPG